MKVLIAAGEGRPTVQQVEFAWSDADAHLAWVMDGVTDWATRRLGRYYNAARGKHTTLNGMFTAEDRYHAMYERRERYRRARDLINDWTAPLRPGHEIVFSEDEASFVYEAVMWGIHLQANNVPKGERDQFVEKMLGYIVYESAASVPEQGRPAAAAA